MNNLENKIVTVQDYLNNAHATLANSSTAKFDAQLIIAYACDWTMAQLWARLSDPFPVNATELTENLLSRRQLGEPIAYILQKRDFWNFTLHVNSDTLIPRPETELLVETALTRLPKNGWLIDAGTGTGAIALALSTASPDCQVIALDKSWSALQVAHLNCQLVHSSVYLLRGHWLQSLKNECAEMIVSNPPYIAENDPHLLQGDVVFEPRSALVAGKTGLETYQEIIPEALRVLKFDGWLGVEHGINQQNAIEKIFIDLGFKNISLLKDLAGISRVIWGQKI
ncbi:MAG: peptide chain release factor N(5)-glutamine methyltransferase [Pseudomonadota bacterium]